MALLRNHPPRMEPVQQARRRSTQRTSSPRVTAHDATPPAPEIPADIQVYTTAQAAQILRVHERTVLAQIHAGTIASFRVGRCIRISATALADLVSGANENARTVERASV